MAHQKQSAQAWSEQLNFSMLELTNGLPQGLLTAVCHQESLGDPNAVSHVGARGLFQFMPGTAGDFGIDPFNPEQSAQAAARYLSQHLSRHNGDVAKALACYNWGMGNVQKAVDKYGDDWLSHAPAETRDYVAKITSAMGGQIYNSPLRDRSIRRPTQNFEEYDRSQSSAGTEDNWLKQMLTSAMDGIGSLGTMLLMLFAAVAGSRTEKGTAVASSTPATSAPTAPKSGAEPAEPTHTDIARAQEQAKTAVDGCSIPGNGVCVAQAEAQANLPPKAPWEVDLALRG